MYLVAQTGMPPDSFGLAKAMPTQPSQALAYALIFK
jgi:hypothetical protein